MTYSVSIGDLSRAALMRQANAQLKTRLVTLMQESASGLKADMALATRGNLGRLAHVETRLTAFAAYRQSASAAQGELAGLQGALDAIGKIGSETAPGLLGVTTARDDATIRVRSAQARQDFLSVVGLMNIEVGGRHLLSGTRVETAPLPDGPTLMAEVKTVVAGLTDPAGISLALAGWFGAPQGGGGFVDAAFRGNDQERAVLIGPDTTARHALTAIDPAFRDLLMGLALAALADDPDVGIALGRDEKAALLIEGGARLASGNQQLNLRRAEVGVQEDLIQRAASRNAAAETALSLARSEIRAADPYETATALSQTEANLQQLYAVTARLSRLSLADYL